jgi:hypothetical protein
VRFFLGTPPSGLLCAQPTQSPRRFEWTSTGGSSATLTIGGIVRNGAATGRIDACARSGQRATLTVTGPGGTDTDTLTVP